MDNDKSPNWADITEAARMTYPGAPLDLAIIATVDPRDLYDDINGVILKSENSSLAIEKYNKIYELKLRKSNVGVTDHALYEAARKAIETEEKHQESLAEAKLANRTEELRMRLSRSSRWAATLLATAVIGAITPVGLTLENANSSHNKSGALAIKQEWSESFIEAETTASLILSLFCGVGVHTLTLGRYSSKSAHRKAQQKIADLES
jgi:hypothetical protein